MDIIGGLRGRPVKMVKGRVTGLPFPAHAEIVLEGYITPDKRATEGPFGEWTGHYAGGAAPRPVLDIKAIYHRNDPILLGVPPIGAGPDEMARYRAVLRSAMVKQNMTAAGVPEVAQVWCHEIGGGRPPPRGRGQQGNPPPPPHPRGLPGPPPAAPPPSEKHDMGEHYGALPTTHN